MIPRTMAIWFVAAIPVLIMFFALAMERLEHHLRRLAARDGLTVQDHDVAGELHAAREALRTRRISRTAVVHSRHAEQRS